MREVSDVVLDRALYLWFSQRRFKTDPILGCAKNPWNLTRKSLKSSREFIGSRFCGVYFWQKTTKKVLLALAEKLNMKDACYPKRWTHLKDRA
ncbi:hypothetical protein TNCV_3348861 [Trichonephila clavipes]|nr:hypothetical protein TNCV_3348861 [Trichonephila clavipes]